MWRSFFFAVGVMLIILGFECLISDHFKISNRARITDSVARIFDEGKPQPKQGASSSNQRWSLFNSSGYNSPFGGKQSGADGNYYGGTSSNSFQDPAKQPFSLAGFGSNSGQDSSRSNSQGFKGSEKGSRIIYTRDWMPWSLLAAGTLVVLYTKATRRGLSLD